jgi:SAM-dependent methyltransferase
VAKAARAALDGRAGIEAADLGYYQPPDADVVLLLDVLHYLDAAAQELIVARACRALRPGGLLLLREPDAAGGRQFLMTRAAERAMAVLRGQLRQRFHYRSGEEWLALLHGHGLEVTATGASRGTPFANVLIEGRATQARWVGRASISE